MANTIKTIPNVKVNGSSQAFQGSIFSVDYQVGITEPSKLTLSFISEKGTYDEPALSVEDGKGYQIAVGAAIQDTFFAYRWEKTEGSNGKRLDVMFLDGSVILDKKWVGLHKKMGDKHSQQPKSLIILGSETHPCDVDDDRAFTMDDVAKISYDNNQDPCRLKCPGENDEEALKNISVNPIVEECKKKYVTELLEVEYNFAELIYYMKQSGVKIVTPFSIQKSGPTGDLFKGGVRDYYYANYTGGLRDVLTRWCDELALIFYWENGGLNFLDVSKQPKVNPPTFDCVTEQVTSKTLEGTIGRGAITYYGREGEIYDNDCVDPQRQELRCLTLQDLFGRYYYPTKSGGNTGTPESAPGGNDSSGNNDDGKEDEIYKDDIYPNGVSIDDFEVSCMCSYYDSRLRDQNILYNYYKITDQKQAKEHMIGKRLDRYGAMMILDVFAKQLKTESGYNQAGYELLTSGKTQKLSDQEKQSFSDNDGYFVIAEFDPNRHEEQFHVEHNLAANFIGKHWVRAYYQAYWGSLPQVSPVGQYLAAGNVEIKEMEFAQFFHSDGTTIANLAQEFKKDPRSAITGQPITQPDELERNVLSLIYYQKNPCWTPNLQKTNPFKTLLDNYAGKLPFVVKNVTREEKKQLLPKLADGTVPKDDYYDSLSVIGLFPGYEFTVTSQVVEHLDEEDVYYQLVPPYKPGGDYPRLYYGLTSKKTYLYMINGIPVYFPAGASVQYDFNKNVPIIISSNNTPLAAQKFAVMVSVGYKPHIEIGKVETTMMSEPPNSEAMKVEYVVKNVNDGTIKPINKLTVDAQGVKRCVLSPETIKTFHTLLNKDMLYSITDPFESIKISFPGIDLPGQVKAQVQNGLEGLSIRLDESSAVISSYSFGNSLFKNVSVDVRQKALEFAIKDQQTKNQNSNFLSNRRRVDPKLGDIPTPTNQGDGNYSLWQM